MGNRYNQEYFLKFKKQNLLHRLFIKYVDRKEPIYTIIKRQLPSQATLLDIGCGNGNFLRYAQADFVATGIDFSKSAITLAKKQAPASTLKVLSAYQLKRLHKTYQCITCFDTLEHLKHPEKVLRTAHTLLKNDGLLVISAPNAGCISRLLKWKNWFAFKDPTHIWFLDHHQWANLLTQNGFIPMRFSHSGLIDPPYLPFIPNIIQTILLKYPTQALSLLGVLLPMWLGETCFIVALKNTQFRFKA